MYPLFEGYSHIEDAFDFFECDFHVLNMLVFVPISNQRNIKENVPVECETSQATSQGRMYCCFMACIVMDKASSMYSLALAISWFFFAVMHKSLM